MQNPLDEPSSSMWDEITLDFDLGEQRNLMHNLATIILSIYCSLSDDREPESSMLLLREGELSTETGVGELNLNPVSDSVIESDSFQILLLCLFRFSFVKRQKHQVL